MLIGIDVELGQYAVGLPVHTFAQWMYRNRGAKRDDVAWHGCNQRFLLNGLTKFGQPWQCEHVNETARRIGVHVLIVGVVTNNREAVGHPMPVGQQNPVHGGRTVLPAAP
ncbi:hypothetical protein DIJ64_00870 [Mycobacterium leprae]|uniref:Uncharacterized protein MLCB373.16c n=1 Tax=Mycobacterium leprae TaxID=1769 RepID=Q9Z5H2_MYCLR|nr:hypothetical protein DIJ64_00870 [Mycobacterium leprae]OAR20655.1 hypothetical protein A8144_09960 [Mycobacterium leprae 3125609]OAX70869.1 hypothetical protein A3216_09445 [Mycobacterium leprae 7935681]CAB36678.1 hypothetical protein MLCB373.16c [Mycobacterium leprae]